MSTVTLDQIWKATAEDLAPALASEGKAPSSDMRLNRIAAAIIYYNAGMLDPEDALTVSNPQFIPVMQTVDNPEQGRELILHPMSAEEIEAKALPENFSNEGLVLHFMKLAEDYSILQDDIRANTFTNVARIIESLPYPVTLANVDEFKKVKGVGPSSVSEMKTYLRTGTSPRLQELNLKTEDLKAVLNLFKGIYGVGAVKALELLNKGYRTLGDLEAAILKEEVPIPGTRSKKGQRPLLTAAQRAGLKWHSQIVQRIPRAEMQEWVQRLTEVLGPEEGVEGKSNKWLIAGSYRRGEPSSGDVDILMRNDTGAPLSEIVRQLQDAGLILEVLALGDKKFMGIGRLGPDRTARRIDIRLFGEAWPYALLYNTGSQQFNILTRQRALSFEPSLSLNEYALTNPATGESYPAETEEDIFRLLGLKYLSPEERTRNLTTLPLA